jgi:signal transduction histidine kinase
MRNPLSALIGCADEIISSLTEYRSVFKSEASSPTLTPTAVINTDSSLSQRIPPLATYLQLDPRYLINEAVEAAETIIYCAMHQKRVIDDVLTLSRLDSCLLLITPSPTRPLPLIRSALKMFDAELKCSHTELNYVEDESIKRMRVDRDMLMLDPSRILQVLINLMTNAIKFTRTEEKREICVRMAASFIPPIENTEGINYVEWGTNSTDQTTKPEWGNGEVVYLSITVTDTGQGLSSNEMKNLFHLFAQASPKTHQTYGGSELALYISSQLVHMQGGKIGVQSTQGQGSTFTYYVKTRRTTAAQETGSVSNMDSIHSYDTEAKNYELLARADALREACGVDASVLHNGNMTVNMQISQSKLVHRPYNMNVSREQLHILVVEGVFT